jgi:hypothetical protein
MSKPHLRALQDALVHKGWRIVAVHPGDDYRISGTWEIQRRSSQPGLLLDFQGMGPDGDYCLPLEKSYGCQVRGRPGASLYFRKMKRSRKLWEEELAAFVQALDNQGSAGKGGRH